MIFLVDGSCRLTGSSSLFELKIERIVHRGFGLARKEGKVVFVPNVLPGERVVCQIEQERGSWVYARPVKIIEKSPFRIEPACKYYPQCGGCQFAHIEYSHQLEVKQQALIETFARISNIEISQKIKKIIPAPEPWRYRIRIRLHCSPQKGVGFQAPLGAGLVVIDDCLLAKEELGSAIKSLPSLIRSLKWEKEKAIELDIETHTGKINAVLSAKMIFAYHNGDFITSSPTKKEWLRLLSFVQPNPEQNQKLKQTLKSLVKETKAKNCLELFAGWGNFSFELAELVENLVCVELNPYAVELARIYQKELKASNIRFIQSPCEKYLESVIKRQKEFDLVILDPPRSGARKESALLTQLLPQHIIYISCEPTTLARDLKILADFYELKKIILLDMFPQTFHIESISLLKRKVKA